MAQIQFSLMKKKDWTSRTLAKLPPPTSDNISFCLTPTPPQSGRHMCITPNISHIFGQVLSLEMELTAVFFVPYLTKRLFSFSSVYIVFFIRRTNFWIKMGVFTF